MFGAPVTTSLAGLRGLDDAALANLTADSVPDAAVAGFFPEGSRLNLLTNNGSGAFSLATATSMPIAVSRVAAGDLDGDGRSDIVLLGGSNQSLVMFQTAPGAFEAPRALH